MPSRIVSGLLAAGVVLLFAPAVSAATPGVVTVRVEGAADTLVPLTQITTSPEKVIKDGHECSGTSGGGALNQATAGNWSGWDDSFGFTVSVIKGEAHSFTSPLYWGVYVNDVLADVGVCDAELQPGDDVLFAPDNTPGYGGPKAVLRLSGVPATSSPGATFSVKVVATTTTFDTTRPYTRHIATVPAAGATVGGGGASATTGADGLAQLTLAERGATTVRATRGADIRSASAPVCITDGADGACGTTRPAACATNGRDGLCGTRDRTAPLASILGIREGERFARAKGPRGLRGSVGSPSPGAPRQLTPGDPSGVLMVKLRLTRNDHGHCAAFSGSRERFIPRPCGASHGWWFKIGDRAAWSYLLPARLTTGRYVLDVNAIDRAYNRDDARQRGRNRVVFTVR